MKKVIISLISALVALVVAITGFIVSKQTTKTATTNAGETKETKEIQTITPNERIAQIIFAPYLKVNFVETKELSETTRGTGGFGSTN